MKMTENEAVDKQDVVKWWKMKEGGKNGVSAQARELEEWTKTKPTTEKSKNTEEKKIICETKKKNALQHIHLCNFSYSLDSLS